jgi:FkbM family methyltransferase
MGLRQIVGRVLKGHPLRRPQLSYGHNGEDLVLNHIFEGQRTGFFVDVGAHHPMIYSNTYLLYRRGWRGINIDAEPGSMRPFNRWRARDINVEAAIGTKVGAMTYFRFNAPALNTFDPDEAELKNAGQHRIVERIQIPMRRLADVLAEHLPAGQAIDFMTIDVEGFEIEVLESSDWERFRPRYVLAEILRTPVLELGNHRIVKWLQGVGYRPVAQAFNTTFFENVRPAA